MGERVFQRIGIVGAGAWGTALALIARRAGRDAILWAHEPEVADDINARHANPLYLPGVELDPDIVATTDPGAVTRADAILLVTPAQHTRGLARRLAPHWRDGTPALICAKGIEQESGKLLSEVVAEELPGAAIAVLSGPTFASEVARNLPTAVTLAARDAKLADALARALGTPRFRAYTATDVVGAEIGGAVKNVIAIACGIVEGRKLGDNARAALITRGLAEIIRLARAKGGDARTLMGLSGLGDLTLTCNAVQSRNFSLGLALGRDRPLAVILAERTTVAEGVFSASSVMALARRLGVEMPICAAVDAVLNRGADLDSAIAGLLARPVGTE
jgi:glycerol-3-phosphate dehydrogenase (NAD(P)+)